MEQVTVRKSCRESGGWALKMSISSKPGGNRQVVAVGKVSWRWEWLSTPVFLPGESHGQKSLAGYSLWGGKESAGLSD